MLKQQQALLETEGIDLVFTDEAVKEIAKVAEEANTVIDNIGARRLYTIIERIIEEISFTAPEQVLNSEIVNQILMQSALTLARFWEKKFCNIIFHLEFGCEDFLVVNFRTYHEFVEFAYCEQSENLHLILNGFQLDNHILILCLL